MDDMPPSTVPEAERKLQPYLSPLNAWALAIGCAVGQGAFLMPGKLFLPYGGPVGAVIGLFLGAGLMLLVARCFDYMMRRHPDAGGGFTYAKKTLGYDHGFLSAWFLLIAFLAVLWANTTALPIFLRNVFGDLLMGDWCYPAPFRDNETDVVYVKEIFLSLAVLVAASRLCIKKSFAAAVQTMCALGLCGVAVVAFLLVFMEGGSFKTACTPAFSPDCNPFFGIVTLVALAPWAYVGFESISNSAAEFRFDHRKVWRIFAWALGAGALVYALLTLIAVAALPNSELRKCADWHQYLTDIGEYAKIDPSASVPTFYAFFTILGPLGKWLFGIGGMCAVLTGIVGNYIAASRLLYALGQDRLLPAWFGRLGPDHSPKNALFVIMAVSFILPFLGWTAITWIVDVTTVGATIVYAYAAASTLVTARNEANRRMATYGWIGLAVSLALLAYFLYPKDPGWGPTTLGTQSYFILAAWSILGFLAFRHYVRSDANGRLGVSVVVWVVIFGLIAYSSVMWMHHDIHSHVMEINEFPDKIKTTLKTLEFTNPSLSQAEVSAMAKQAYENIKPILADVEKCAEKIHNRTENDITVAIVLIAIALAVMMSVFHFTQKRKKQLELDKQLAEEVSEAKTSFLSNMSHEIRTPMNAIIGLDNIALRDPDLPPRTRVHLEKIGTSAHHLLGLINDILDMSRIESGRMVLKEAEFSFKEFLEQINVIINGQCADKCLTYAPKLIGEFDDYYVGDDLKLKQVLINILGNAVKFTAAPGTVFFTTEATSRYEGYRTMTFTIRDTGIGMDKAFLPRIFEPFSQEDATTTNRYGGSGLGMAITKNLVVMMGGEIKVDSEKGKGTTFTVTVTLKASSRSFSAGGIAAALSRLRVLVVDDDPVAVDHAKLELATIGINAEACPGSLEALRLVRDRRAQRQPFDFMLTDLKMPNIDGVELTRRVREFDHGETAVVVMTGYDFDPSSEQAANAGVDGFLYKPLFANSLQRELLAIMRKREMEIPPEAEAEAAPAGPSLAGCRVLIAEDMDLNAEILADLLEIEGVKSDRAENGEVALKMFGDSAPNYYDAVLMDMRMPVMDGLAATRAIRALDRPDASEVPIVAMTANAFEDDVQRSLQAGLNAHLTKPVEPERLYEVLRQLIVRRAGKQ